MDGRASCTPGTAGGSCCACCTSPAAPCLQEDASASPDLQGFYVHACMCACACARVCPCVDVHLHPCTLLPAGRPCALLLCSQAWHCLNAANITQMGSQGLIPRQAVELSLTPCSQAGAQGSFLLHLYPQESAGLGFLLPMVASWRGKHCFSACPPPFLFSLFSLRHL